MSQNRFVSFVSDSDFLECVRWVCRAYPKQSEEVDMSALQRNVIDPFKMVFDMANRGMDMHSWIQGERMRQEDKTINNTIGEFHQKLLGKVDGWEDLGVGDESKVDLKKNDNSIFIEIKNKFNTMNSDATASCRRKLEAAVQNNPDAMAYWCFLISRNGTSGEDVWRIRGRETNPAIKKAWGNKVYEIVTGNPSSLEEVWRALPLAIHDIRDSTGFDNETREKMVEFFRVAFGSHGNQSDLRDIL